VLADLRDADDRRHRRLVTYPSTVVDVEEVDVDVDDVDVVEVVGGG
jgi:hypothetical protein